MIFRRSPTVEDDDNGGKEVGEKDNQDGIPNVHLCIDNQKHSYQLIALVRGVPDTYARGNEGGSWK